MSQTQSSIFTAIEVQTISYIILNTITPDSVFMDKFKIKNTIDKNVPTKISLENNKQKLFIEINE